MLNTLRNFVEDAYWEIAYRVIDVTERVANLLAPYLLVFYMVIKGVIGLLPINK